MSNEKNLSAKQQEKKQEARLFKPHVHQAGKKNHQSQKGQGQKTSGGLGFFAKKRR
jgi:hypothetical protein